MYFWLHYFGHSWTLPHFLLTHLLFQQPDEGKLRLRYSLSWLYCFLSNFLLQGIPNTAMGQWQEISLALTHAQPGNVKELTCLNKSNLLMGISEKNSPLFCPSVRLFLSTFYISVERHGAIKSVLPTVLTEEHKSSDFQCLMMHDTSLTLLPWYHFTSKIPACQPMFQKDGHRKGNDSYCLLNGPFFYLPDSSTFPYINSCNLYNLFSNFIINLCLFVDQYFTGYIIVML